MNDETTPADAPLEATSEEQKLLRQLRANPLLADQFNALADKFEREIANGMDAHQAEAALIDSLQQLGAGLMRQWAHNTQRDLLLRADPTLQKHSKKKLRWHTTFGVIGIEEQVMRDGRRGSPRHPFRDFAGVSSHGPSRVLQRRIVDFAAERSFQATAAALREHYRIEVPIYTIDKATADISRQAKHFNSEAPAGIRPAATLISETDGSMLPIVAFRQETTAAAHGGKTDRRKLRHCHWKEIRVSTARAPGSTEAWYGVAVGEPLAVGLMMTDCCRFQGMHDGTHIHAVADGAPWIAEQYERQFGTRSKFHLDFYHVCDHLAAAAGSTPMDAAGRKLWLDARKESLRTSDTKSVIAALEALAPERGAGEESNPVVAAIAYLEKRAHQLDYAEAIRRDLPIGSGEVESAHRHLLQKRLKIPGAWWQLERAEEMAQLRAMRANHRWDAFWQKKAA